MGWLFQRKQQASAQQHCLGIELHKGKPYAVLVCNDEVVQTYRPQPEDNGFAGLEQWLQAHQITAVPVVISLDELDYQLHLVEAPPVADAELADALRFRMRDLMTADGADVMLQPFRLPQDAYRGRMDMVFAAVVERTIVKQLVSWCRHQQLQLKTITIPEMSVLSLVAEFEPESAVGVLRLDDSEGMIYLLREGAMYLSRRLNIGAAALCVQEAAEGELSLSTDSQVDALALEIQRSLDYFDSQIGMGVVSEIWVLAPDGMDVSDALPQLETSVNTPVRLLNPSRYNSEMQTVEMTASLALALANALTAQREVA